MLVSKAEVDNQVEIDVNMYRQKASSYHESGGRLSFGQGRPTESPSMSKIESKDYDKPGGDPITSRYIISNPPEGN